jgi:hypothetical protein
MAEACRAPFASPCKDFYVCYPLLPFLSGCGTIAQTSFFSFLLKGKNEPRVHLKSGELIVVPPNDYVGRAVFYFGDLGSPPSAVMRSRIAARSTTAGTPVKSCMAELEGPGRR